MKFDKYEKYGAYHWVQTDHRLLNFKFVPLLYARYKKIIDLIPKNVESVIDVGCGDGMMLYYVHQRIPIARLVGVDSDSTGLTYAAEKLKQKQVPVTLKQGSIYNLEYPTNSFDIVLSGDVIEHLEDYTLAIEEMYRILKPGGLLLLSTPLRRESKKWSDLHIHEFTGTELLELCNKYFKKCVLTACWSKFWIGCWRIKPIKLLINCAACLGWNPFLKEGDPYSGKYQQLIISCEK